MFGFSSKVPSRQCAVIIDIGSGSVGVAIVVSDIAADTPEIVWTHREHGLIRDIASVNDNLKQVSTALVNVFLELGSTGLKTLKEFDSNLQISTVQVALCAPWSYTVTKTVHYTNEHPFTVDEDLIEELIATGKKQTLAAMKEAEINAEGLEFINNISGNIRINGYRVASALGKKGRSAEISCTSVLADQYLLKTVSESVEKVIPNASIDTYSFMLLYYRVLSGMHPDTAEACLVDITNEATEVAVIRDGILTHVTHGPYGTFTLAREISLACNIPKDEAYAYLKSESSFVDTKLSEQKREQLDAILSAYELKIASLFKSTGDELSIPKTIYLHTDAKTEAFFTKHIERAAEAATHSNHSVHLITSKLLDDTTTSDTPILLSARYYHQITRGAYELE